MKMHYGCVISTASLICIEPQHVKNPKQDLLQLRPKNSQATWMCDTFEREQPLLPAHGRQNALQCLHPHLAQLGAQSHLCHLIASSTHFFPNDLPTNKKQGGLQD